MRKGIIAVVVLVLVVAGVFIGYNFIKSLHAPPADALQAIPAESAVILHSTRSDAFWNALSGTSVIWEELKQLEQINDAHLALMRLDSLLRLTPELKRRERAVFAGLKRIGKNQESWLFATEMAGDEIPLFSGLAADFANSSTPAEAQTYQGVELFALEDAFSGRTLYYYGVNGIVAFSYSKILIEESVRQVQGSFSLRNDSAFLQAFGTLGGTVPAHVLVNNSRFSELLSSISAPTASWVSSHLSGWTALDLQLRGNDVNLSGFVLHSDSSKDFLAIFENGNAPKISVTEIMPASTSNFLVLAFGEFQDFYSRYKSYLGGQNKLPLLEQKLEQISDSCRCNAADAAIGWIGNQAAVFSTEFHSAQGTQQHYMAFMARDTDDAMINLRQLVSTPADSAKWHYQEVPVFQLAHGNLYEELLPKPFSGFPELYFCQIRDYIVFGATPESLFRLIRSVNSTNTLADSENFKSFSDQISSRSNLLLYSAPAKSVEFYKTLSSETGTEWLSRHSDLLQKFQGFIYQLNFYKENMFYNHLYLRHNPEIPQKPDLLWELDLKAPIAGCPYLVKNHYTGNLEILVQDTNHVIHLISPTGRILWSEQLNGPIMGAVQQIDVYKNGKLQMLFNTPTSIYLLDRNGHAVENFPVKLAASATAPLAVADYENTKDYRIFIPLADRSIRLFNASGKFVKGWDNPTTKAIVRQPVKHIRAGSKDYIFAADTQGAIYLLDRRGNMRHQVSEKIRYPATADLFFEVGKNISSSGIIYTDSLGNVVKLGFDNTIKKLGLLPHPAEWFQLKDVNRDGKSEILLKSGDELKIFDSTGSEMNEFEVISNSIVQYFSLSERAGWFAIADTIEQKLHLMDLEGTIHPAEPLLSGRFCTIADINQDGSFEVVAAAKSGQIYIYSLEELDDEDL